MMKLVKLTGLAAALLCGSAALAGPPPPPSPGVQASSTPTPPVPSTANPVCSATTLYNGSTAQNFVLTAKHCVASGNGTAAPGRPAGGWTEYRFPGAANPTVHTGTDCPPGYVRDPAEVERARATYADAAQLERVLAMIPCVPSGKVGSTSADANADKPPR